MKKILFLLFSLSLFLFSCAQDMDPEATDNDTAAGFTTDDSTLNAVLEDMNALISDLYGGKTRSGGLTIASITPFSTQATRAVSETPPAYIVNFENNNGFAVISTDPVSDNIITISNSGSLSVEELELAYSIVTAEQIVSWNDEDDNDNGEDEDDYEEGDEPGGSYGDGITYGDEHITLEWDPLPFDTVDFTTSLTPGDYDFTATADINPAAYAVANYIYTTVQINAALYLTTSPPSAGGTFPPSYNVDGWITEGGVSPLIKTKWHQSKPYNNHAPFILNTAGTYTRALAGCTSITVSQIAAYYKKPADKNWDIISYFGRYDPYFGWYNESDTNAPIVASFIREVGDYLKNEWGINTTSATIKQSKKYFKRRMGLTHVSINKYKYSRIIDRLNKRCPVYMYGQNSVGGGHMWIVDGYIVQTKGDETRTLFHSNWGWGNGKYDGFYVAGVFDATQRPELYDKTIGDKGNTSSSSSNNYYKSLKTITWKMV